MNELGQIFLWSSIQVTLLLIPAMAIHAVASRRSPSSGAWIATLSLLLSLIITLVAWLPRPTSLATSLSAGVSAIPSDLTDERLPDVDGVHPSEVVGRAAMVSGWLAIDLSWARRNWESLQDRLGEQAAAPVREIRRWGRAVASLAIVSASVCLVHLVMGLFAVWHCLFRARAIGDDPWVRLLDELRRSLGLRRKVRLLETRELFAPATAGWIRPAILLPVDARDWDEPTRRAVLAHELAHIGRGDYAAGLISRLALALHFYHPLVHWFALRLQLQQEQAADAIGVRLGGGRVSYLLALSQLALRQDAKVPCWPARAFLPVRGDLIRRIAMLTENSQSVDRPMSGAGRWLAAAGLLGIAMLVSIWKSPVRASDDPQTDTSPATGKTVQVSSGGSDSRGWFYVPEDVDGLIQVRPAAVFRRLNKPGLVELANRTIGLEFAMGLFADLHGNPRTLLTSNDRPTLSLAELDRVTVGLRLGVGHDASDLTKKLHSLMFRGLALRTFRPFDWLTFLRAWDFSLQEVRTAQGVYYRSTGTTRSEFGPEPCVYFPDDRTLVVDSRDAIERLVQTGARKVPDHFEGADWKAASRGVFALAFHNGPEFVKRYDLGRPDDAVVLSLLKGMDHWIMSVDDADSLRLHATARLRPGASPAPLVKEADSLIQQGRHALENPAPNENSPELQTIGLRLARSLLCELQITSSDQSVKFDARGFGTFADITAILEPQLKETEALMAKEIAASRKDDTPRATR